MKDLIIKDKIIDKINKDSNEEETKVRYYYINIYYYLSL